MANKKRILVADDEPGLLELLKMDLSREGYEVLLADNGKDALKLAMTEKLDLILLDVMMPHIDGYHIAFELTQKLGASAPRIVIMTCRDTVKERPMALLGGACDILQKPLVLATVHKCLAALLSGAA